MIWYRMPGFTAGRLHGDHVATEVEAWADLLGRWHMGEDVSACAFVTATGWGKGRVLKFMERAAAWARDNGSTMPDRWRTDHSADRKRTDMRTNASKEQPTDTNGVGPESDRTSDQVRTVSRARSSFKEREETRGDESEFSAPASGAGTLTQQQEHEPWTTPTTVSTGCTSSPPNPEAATLTATSTSAPTVTRSTITPMDAPIATTNSAPLASASGRNSDPARTAPDVWTASAAACDTPPPPSDEDYYASETMDGLPAFDAVNGLLDGAHRGDGAEGGRGVEGAPPAPQRRTAATDPKRAEAAGSAVRAADAGPVADHPRRSAGGHPQGRDGVGDPAGVGVDLGGPRQRPGSDGVSALGADPGRPAPVGLFGALNGPSSASTGASHATVPAEGVAGKGGASGRGKRAPKPPAEPKPVPVANRLIGEWKASHLEAHGEEYVITPVCAKKLRELVKDEPADADLSGWRAAFDAFNRKGFGDFPKGFTAMGFAIDPPRWRQQARAEVAGISTAARNGRPVAPSYADTLRELEEMERAAATRNGAMDATYEVVQ